MTTILRDALRAALVGALLAAGLAPAQAQGSGPPEEPARPVTSPAPPAEPAPAEVPSEEEAADAAAPEPDGSAPNGAADAGPAPSAPEADGAPAATLEERVEAFLADHRAELSAWWAVARSGALPDRPHPHAAAPARAKALIEAGWSGGRDWLLERAMSLWPDPADRARQRRALLDAAFAAGVSAERVEALGLAVANAAGDLVPSREEGARWEERCRELVAAAQDRGATAAALAALGSVGARLAPPADDAALAAPVAWLELVRTAYTDTPAARPAAVALYEIAARAHLRALDAHWRRASDAPPAPDPTVAAWPRMLELAEAGAGPARWWLVVHAGAAVADAAERRALQRAQVERLVELHANEAWLADAVRVAETLFPEFGADLLRSMGERLIETSDHPEVRAWTLHNLALSYARDRADPRGAERAAALLARLCAEQPGHRLARAAETLAFELRHLRIDAIPPDVLAQDVDGRDVRLSHTRGLVTALFFWGSWDAPSVAVARELVALESRFADAPFTVLGVVTDSDRDAYRKARAEIGIGWVDAWQGSPGGPWPTAWGVRDFPRLFLFDADGRLRYRDLDGDALVTAVRRLVREARPGYEPAAPRVAAQEATAASASVDPAPSAEEAPRSP